MDSAEELFARLFEGNSRGHGVHKKDPKGKWSNWSVKGAPTKREMFDHLGGTQGVGVVPIRADNTCVFGCIDYDIHHRTKVEVSTFEVAETVKAHDVPAIVTRSKSGGAHLWFFFSDPVPAVDVRRLLARYVDELEFGSDAEVFPKQSYLRADQTGNTINLPYYDVDETERYAAVGNDKLSLKGFVTAAVQSALSHDKVRTLMGGEHADAPPCLQHIINKGTSQGNRNEAAYNLTIYMRKKNPVGYKDDVMDLNHVVFDRPLPIRELKRTISSASRQDYRYRCDQSPCRDFCDKNVCLSRKFGIAPEEIISDTDIYTKLIKHTTDPVQWQLVIDDKAILINTHILMDHRRLMEAVADATTKVIPALKPGEWLRKLSYLMEHAEVREAPADATAGGQLVGKLSEFIRRVRVPEGDVDAEEAREALLRGQPVAEETQGGDVVVHFRGKDFLEFLKRTRHSDTRGATVWMELRRYGVCTGRVRAGKATVAVWTVQADVNAYDHVLPRFKADF